MRVETKLLRWALSSDRHTSSSRYESKGSRFIRSIPEKSTGSYQGGGGGGGGRERGREGGRERGREGGRERGREGEREEGREGGGRKGGGKESGIEPVHLRHGAPPT